MRENSAILLTTEQKEFLNRLVTNYRSGIHSPFIFTYGRSGASVTYRDPDTSMGFATAIDELDLEQLSQARLITIRQVQQHVYQGKPTAKAMASISALAESSENGTGSLGNATAAVPVAGGIPLSGVAAPGDSFGTGLTSVADAPAADPARLEPAPSIGRVRRRGYPAKSQDHFVVARVVAQIGLDWTSRLGQVCLKLDEANAKFPVTLQEGEEVRSWGALSAMPLDRGHAARREHISRYIRYRLEWVARNPGAQT